MTRDFEGRTVLLTGGLGSLGRAQAEAFVAAGASLVLLDRPDHPQAEAFIAGLTGPGSARYLGQDLDDLAGSKAVVAALAEEVGGIDVLVNNAALIVNQPFESFTVDAFEAQMRVNAGAGFVLAQAAAVGMKAKGRGAIINMCSVTLGGDWEGYAPYVASKGALLGLTKALARELGPHGVRVNAVSPGAVVSEAEARVFGDKAAAYQDWVLARQCLKTRILPQDIAAAVTFLASDAARMISGCVLDVDGGW